MPLLLLRRTGGLTALVVTVVGLVGFLFLGCRPGESTSRPAGDGTAGVASRPGDTMPAGGWVAPVPASVGERADERARMVKTQITGSWDRRSSVTDERVLEAMRTVPRHVFVPEEVRRAAYQDSPLPIGWGQTISQPYIVALMTELLHVSPESKVLEIGTGSGYQAAVLAQLTPHVYTIEIVEPLADRARRVLAEQGYTQVHCRRGDGYKGWPEAAPFDGIIVTCAAEDLPEPLWEQLRPGGRIVIPTGSPDGYQELVVVSKTLDGQRRSETIIPVRFVPLTRERDDK